MTTIRTASTAPPGARLLAQRVRDVFSPYPKALAGSADPVHDLRVASRRLRVALPLLAAEPDAKRVRRAGRTLRDLARAAGVCRDLDVGAEIIAGMATREDGSGAVAAIRRTMARARTRGRARSREALLDLDVARLRRDLRAILVQGIAGDEEVRRRIDDRARDESLGIAAPLDADRRRFDPAALHEVRRRARRLRYGAEVAEALFGAAPDESERWKKVQTRLGDINDRIVLARWLEALGGRAARRGEPDVARLAESMRLRVLRDARHRHRAFLERQIAPVAPPRPQAPGLAV
jgi:CHAD domain-containing protein